GAAGVSTPADADVAKRQLPTGKSADGPHFDVVAVKMLLGNAVADHDDHVAILKEELLRPRALNRLDRGERENDQTSPSVSHGRTSSLTGYDHVRMAATVFAHSGGGYFRLQQ